MVKQGTNKNEVTRFEEKVHEGWKLFQRVQQFHDYLFKNRYAKGSPNASDGNKWYIPYHGRYHPAEPEKIRVVFDCIVEYFGYTLNKQLIPGPDLTNQIVGVLTRFGEEQVSLFRRH